MQDLPLIRVRYVQRFAAALERLGHAPGPILARCQIDQCILNVPDGFMPISQLHDFVEAAATESGNWHLGLDAGINPRKHHSLFSNQVAAMPTLLQSVQTLCANSKTEDASANFQLRIGDQYAWLCCGSIDGRTEAIRQIELFRYAALLEVVRSTAGGKWLPSAITLQSADDGGLDHAPLIREVLVRFGASQLAIAIPADLLSQSPRPVTTRTKASPPEVSSTGELPFEKAVKEVIRTHMMAHRFSVRNTALAVGMSVRSLQRRLAEAGTSYSMLLEEARIESAEVLLTNDEFGLQDVAGKLGYRHSTHFSRAFRRIYSMSPKQYRLKHCH